MKLYYKLITSDNIQLGIQIQNLIFPMEDGSELYKLSIIGSKDYPILKYFLVYDSISMNEENIVGVSGIYTYRDYPSDAWLAYYGVLEKKRNKGYGFQMLLDFEEYAKENNFKTIRLFTNKLLFPKAFEIYKKFGFIYEKYTNFPKKLDDIIMDNEYVFSKSLNDEKVELWNNKLILDFLLFH